jgi:iron(II)-dependent oxidoreductase
MLSQRKNALLWVLVPASVASLGLAWLLGQSMWAAIGVVGFGYVGLRYHAPLRDACRRLIASLRKRETSPTALRTEPLDPQDTDGLIAQMLGQARYALLLRPQIAENLGERQYRRAFESLEHGMALVPDGEVVLGEADEALDDDQLDEAERAACKGRVIRVEHFFLDRFPVTNEQFRGFVQAGGYEQLNLWDESIWPAILDFVDLTGRPGPAFWQKGRYPAGLERHPVVGISWYEAMAYARWVGKRLPTDAEWVKAASWPVSLSASQRLQRRYPWGESMERKRANLWGSGPNTTVPVDDYPDGVSVGGAYHLIGNVWEWTRGDFRGIPGLHGELTFDRPMKSLRGGAFDTYFDNQATCQFQSGEAAIARKHNIGFRCALSVCDLHLARGLAETLAQSQPENAPGEEVEV